MCFDRVIFQPKLVIIYFQQYPFPEIQPSTKPKPVPRPTKPVNLMDNEPRNTDLTSPLLPMPINLAPATSVSPTPVATIEMKKPIANEKNFSQQNYVNVEIGEFPVTCLVLLFVCFDSPLAILAKSLDRAIFLFMSM